MKGETKMDEKRLETLYRLLSQAEDEETTSALRWAIFNLENLLFKKDSGYCNEASRHSGRYHYENGNIGTKHDISLKWMGTFTATAHKITDEGVLFIFDQVVTLSPINFIDIYEFEASALYAWLQKVLLPLFPAGLRNHIQELTIPTVGQIFGHEDGCYNTFLVEDNDDQLPLMKDPSYRIATFNGKKEWYWLRNAIKKRVFWKSLRSCERP